LAVSTDRGQGHGVGQREPGFDGFIHPAPGLLYGIVVEEPFAKALGMIFFAYVFHGLPGVQTEPTV
jgi:hypothetical protein